MLLALITKQWRRCWVAFGSVHIRDKTTVGERLAAAGIKAAYNGTETYVQGPIVGAVTLKSPGIIQIAFDNVGSDGPLCACARSSYTPHLMVVAKPTLVPSVQDWS